LEKLKEAYPDLLIVPCSADSELALREASKAGLIDYIPGYRSPGATGCGMGFGYWPH
jgi:hypothetical protein